MFNFLSPKMIATLVCVGVIYFAMMMFGVSFSDIAGYFQSQPAPVVQPLKTGMIETYNLG